MTPAFYWSKQGAPVHSIVDACQAYGRGTYIKDGKRAIPTGAKVCEKRHFADMDMVCYMCEAEEK